MKTLINYFKEKSYEKLDKQSKAILYKRISKQISLNHGFHKTLLSRIHYSKRIIISGMALFVLVFGYIFNPEIHIPEIHFGSVAQADYIGTVISRNGSYQIIDNEHGGNIDSLTQIPKGGSLLVDGGSEVSVKTSNNAIAKVIGPAKITFIKIDNQIIVDVSYGSSIHIEKKSSESLLAVNTDVLVVKTESKTIIGKTSDVNLSLFTNSGSKPLLTSLAGELVVSDDLGNLDSISVKEKDSVLLDSELKLFAVSDKKDDDFPLEKKKNIPLEGDIYTKENSTKENPTLPLNTIIGAGNDALNGDGDMVLTEFSGNLPESGLNLDSGVLAVNMYTDDIKEEKDLFLGTDNDIMRGMEYADKVNSVVVANNEKELQDLLYVKPILDGKLLELLDKLYESYYYTYDKDIFKVKDLIISLCNELEIKCDDTNLIKSLNGINGKVINSYIITPDIKLVQ